MADVIPVDSVANCFKYLLTKATIPPVGLTLSFGTARSAWAALSALGPRLDGDQAGQLLTHVKTLSLGTGDPFLIEAALEALGHALPSLSVERLEEAALLALPLAEQFPTGDHHQIYYRDALNIIHLACKRAGEGLANKISPRLFPTGVTRLDPLKWQLLPLFPSVHAEEGWVSKLMLRSL